MSSLAAISNSTLSFIPPLPIASVPQSSIQATDKPWHRRAIDRLTKWENNLNQRIRNCWIQTQLCFMGVKIQPYFISQFSQYKPMTERFLRQELFIFMTNSLHGFLMSSLRSSRLIALSSNTSSRITRTVPIKWRNNQKNFSFLFQ